MPRIALLLAAATYAQVLRLAHEEYLAVEWGYFGFPIAALTWQGTVLMLGAVLAGALVLPLRCLRVSDVFLWLLYLFVIAPGIVVTTGLGVENFSQATILVYFVTAGYCLTAVLVRSRFGPSARLSGDHTFIVDGRMVRALVASWWITAILLIWAYREIMTFPGLSNVYEQRAAGSAERNSFFAYAQLYFANVFSPALLTIGLVRRRLLLVLYGFAGCLLIYCITGQRTVFALPFALVILWRLLKSNRIGKYFTALSLFFLSGVVMFATLTYRQSKVSDFLSLYLTFRTIGIPGLTLSQYSRVFSNEGYTYGSHIKGISWLVPVPATYASDPGWPSLGYIVADRIYQSPETNQNANLYAGDGIASAGLAGIIIVSLVLALWLRFLDWIVPLKAGPLAILLIFPAALALTNAPLSTTLMSFGGLFWTVFFGSAVGLKRLEAAPVAPRGSSRAAG